MALDDDGLLGSYAVSFRTRALIVAFVYFVYFTLSVVALAVATVSSDALQFGIILPLVTSCLHLTTSLWEFATTSNDVMSKLAVPQWKIVLIGDWLVAAVVGITSTAIAIQGIDNVRIEEVAVANSLMMASQVSCLLKTSAWLDNERFDSQTGEPVGMSGF